MSESRLKLSPWESRLSLLGATYVVVLAINVVATLAGREWHQTIIPTVVAGLLVWAVLVIVRLDQPLSRLLVSHFGIDTLASLSRWYLVVMALVGIYFLLALGRALL